MQRVCNEIKRTIIYSHFNVVQVIRYIFDSMIEIIKALLEEPEKLKKYGLYLARVILNLIFASKLFIWIIGNYHFIDIESLGAWGEFVLSGRILVCCFLYLISDVILFQALLSIPDLGLDLLFKSAYYDNSKRTDRKFIEWVLQKTQVITIDKESKKVFPGKNIGTLYGLLKVFRNEESLDLILKFKRSVINEILHTYCVFLIIYFWVIDFPHYDFVSRAILIGLVFILFFCFGLLWLMDFMYKNSEKLFFDVQLIINEHEVSSCLLSHGFFSSIERKRKYEKYDHYDNEKSIYVIKYGNRPISSSLIQEFERKYITQKTRVILISNSGITKNASIYLDKLKAELLIINLDDESRICLEIADFMDNDKKELRSDEDK